MNTITKIKKRDGRIVEFDRDKIADAIFKAAQVLGGRDKDMAEELVKRFGIDKKKKVCNLSKGMLSMLTVIIGLASKAEITILP